MTRKGVENFFSRVMTNRAAQTAIRGGTLPDLVNYFELDEQDRAGLQKAASAVNELYIKLNPQKATPAQRRGLMAVFGDEVNTYLKTRYG